MWDPSTMAGRTGWRPCRRPDRLPAASTRTCKPASCINRVTYSRPRRSASVKASRVTPWGVPPMRASRSMRSWRRSALTRRAGGAPESSPCKGNPSSSRPRASRRRVDNLKVLDGRIDFFRFGRIPLVVQYPAGAGGPCGSHHTRCRGDWRDLEHASDFPEEFVTTFHLLNYGNRTSGTALCALRLRW